MLIANGSTPTLMFLMVDSTDYFTAETGLSPTVYISKNGGAFAATTNSAAEVASGWYSVALTATETGTDGELVLYATGTGAAIWREKHQVYTSLNVAMASGETVTLATGQHDKIADHTLRRSFESAVDSSDGDTKSFRSLLGAVAKLVNKVALSGSTLTIYEDDDTTALGTQTVTTNASGQPLTSVDTD
ncbi:MAG: hypothetical protein KDE20_11630 [Caldilineaceae bacterium]|nr:hypothetical protein [Caldilineaceae bacterium]